MSRFIHTTSGALNTAFVRRIRMRVREIERDGKTRKQFYNEATDNDGEIHEVTSSPDDVDTVIVPATQPCMLLAVYWNEKGDYNYYHIPVIAWRVTPDGSYPAPVVVGRDGDSPASNEEFFVEFKGLEHPYLGLEGSSYETIDDIIDELKEQHHKPTKPEGEKDETST